MPIFGHFRDFLRQNSQKAPILLIFLDFRPIY